MPTGYTSIVGEGGSFRDYLFRCARAFWALIQLRDDPMDDPLPEQLKASTYHAEALVRITREADEIRGLSVAECEQRALDAYTSHRAQLMDGIAKTATTKSRYHAMLAEVEAWTPPTPDHEELKRFMREQLQQSMKHDCDDSYYRQALDTLVQQTGKDWRAATLKELAGRRVYHRQHQAEEEAMIAHCNAWLTSLIESVPKETTNG